MNEVYEILNLIRPENIKYSLKQLFPDCKKNKVSVYIFGIIHLLIVLIITLGIFIKPSYLIYYIIYLITILTTYIIYDNECIITNITDKLSDMNTYPIKISIKTAKKFLYFQIILATLFILFPKISLYHLIN